MDEKLTYTVPEAAKLLRIGRNGMYGLIKSGKIYSFRVGRNIRIPKVAIQLFLEGKYPA